MCKLFILFFALLLVGCDDQSREITEKYNLPPELKNCRMYVLDGAHTIPVRTLICPHASTSTSWSSGKSTHHAYAENEGGV